MPSNFFKITSHKLLTYSFSKPLARILHFGLRLKSRNRVIGTESASHIATFQNPDQQASQKNYFTSVFHLWLILIRAAEKNPAMLLGENEKEVIASRQLIYPPNLA